MKKKKLKKLLLAEYQKNRDLKDINKASLKIIESYIKQIADIEDIHAVELNKEKERTISAKEFNNALREENQELKEALKETEDIVVLYSNELYKQSQNGEY